MQYNKDISQERETKQSELEKKKEEKAGKEKEIQNWKQEVKKRKYTIAVITELPKDVVNKLDQSAKVRYHDSGEVDYIRKPTGVNRD